jgi:phenylpropionate dioxygenase-like ring-hydroxylating dioxygenase large terminal subunit
LVRCTGSRNFLLKRRALRVADSSFKSARRPVLTTRQPAFRKFWHAVMPLSIPRGGQPRPFTLMGEDIVLFLDASGEPAALKDRCCHRT